MMQLFLQFMEPVIVLSYRIIIHNFKCYFLRCFLFSQKNLISLFIFSRTASKLTNQNLAKWLKLSFKCSVLKRSFRRVRQNLQTEIQTCLQKNSKALHVFNQQIFGKKQSKNIVFYEMFQLIQFYPLRTVIYLCCHAIW